MWCGRPQTPKFAASLCVCVRVCFCILACLVHFLKEDRADSALCFLLGGHGNNTACGVQGNSPDASCLGTWLWKLPSLQRLPQPAPTYLPRSQTTFTKGNPHTPTDVVSQNLFELLLSPAKEVPGD